MPKGRCRLCNGPVGNRNKHGICTSNPDCRLAWRRNNYRSTEYKQIMLGNAKRRANQFGLDFNLTADDIVVPQYCPILGIKLERGSEGKSIDSSPSLDRIRPERGYVKGNVQVVSQKANAMKNNATPSELLDFADWVYATYQREGEYVA